MTELGLDHLIVAREDDAAGTLDMEELARKRLEIIGATFRTRTLEE